MDVKIGISPDSWGIWFPDDPKQLPYNLFLDQIAAAGYEYMELGPVGYLPSDVATLREELQSRNLKVAATFVMAHLEDPACAPEIERQLAVAGELVAGTGGGYIVLIDDVYSDLWTGELLVSREIDDDAWKRLVDKVGAVAQLSRERFGLQTVFHPHAETHVEFEPQIERLIDETDPEVVSFCLDTGHHAYRGGEPVSFMRKHHRRICYLHLKNVDHDKRKEVEANGITFAPAVGQGIFCEPWLGAVDFEAFRDVLQEIDFNGIAIVEQDMYPCDIDTPLPIAKRTREYLKEIGIG
ncbi:MAG: sugar phosphate isomerase/epimerase [Lentisphaeria bacterium]|jgi:inosose dehydratase|nr:sugar phosphate isomerase/epimerase [Lentisphaeria bacterium]